MKYFKQILAKVLANDSVLLAIKDAAELNTLSKYWKKKANKYLQSNKPLKATWALQNIPKSSENYSEACDQLAMLNIWIVVNTDQLNMQHALEYTRSYLENGIELGNKNCSEIYEKFPKDDYLTKEKIKTVMQLLPLATTQVLVSCAAEHKFMKTIRTSTVNNTANFFKPPSIAEIAHAAKITKHGLAALESTTSSNFIKVIENFLKQMQIFRAKYFPRHTVTNTLQAFDDLNTRLNQLICELRNQQLFEKLTFIAPTLGRE